MKKVFLNCLNEYDIRGTEGKGLNDDFGYYLGQILNCESIIIAKDARILSKKLFSSFKDGLVASGSKVIELEGISTSPLLYFAHLHLKTQYAVMITGSHNMPEYSGFKFMKNEKPFYGQDLKNITNNVIVNAKGTHKTIDLRREYLQALLKKIKIIKPFKIAWDCNNSGLASLLKSINIPGEHILLNTLNDGIFRHIPPDPLIENNLKQIKQTIVEHNCNFGFAFDGDADRLVLIKSDGEHLSTDQLSYLLAQILPHKGTIILDVKSSQFLVNQLKLERFKVIIASAGHSIMKKNIIKKNASLACEASGHYIINDSKYYPFDDALYVALRIIEYLQYNPIIELPLAPIRCEYKIPKKLNYNKKIYGLLGIRKNYSYGWFLIRASNTEDYILVKYEANDQKAEKKIKQKIEKSFIKDVSIN